MPHQMNYNLYIAERHLYRFHLTISCKNCTYWNITFYTTEFSPLALRRRVLSPVFLSVCFFRYLKKKSLILYSLQWRHNGRDGISNNQPRHCLLNRLFMRWSKKTSKLRVTGLGVGNSPVTGEFPAQMASNAENVSIWWRQYVNHVKHLCT